MNGKQTHEQLLNTSSPQGKADQNGREDWKGGSAGKVFALLAQVPEFSPQQSTYTKTPGIDVIPELQRPTQESSELTGSLSRKWIVFLKMVLRLSPGVHMHVCAHVHI